jgi:hypothetical protein
VRHSSRPGSHRAKSGKRRAQPKRRAEVRPRYGRVALLLVSATVTGVAVLGALDVVPEGARDAAASTDGDLRRVSADPPPQEPAGPADRQAEDRSASSVVTGPTRARAKQPADAVDPDVSLPPDSGTGYRVVFSESRQRVWLVDENERVVRTYLGSGSIYDNLDPGSYQVYSTSRYATGIDDSGTMEYFVRFTQGDQGAAIGFHSIPVDDGVPVQTEAQLGTPLSHGCIRQRTSDAIALWRFAPIGTTVVVVA